MSRLPLNPASGDTFSLDGQSYSVDTESGHLVARGYDNSTEASQTDNTLAIVNSLLSIGGAAVFDTENADGSVTKQVDGDSYTISYGDTSVTIYEGTDVSGAEFFTKNYTT